MKKLLVMMMCAIMLLGSCTTNAGMGAYAGAGIGSMVGSAFGGLMGGYRGSHAGTLLGAAAGAVIGGAAGAAADQAERRERYEAQERAYERRHNAKAHKNDRYARVRDKIRNGELKSSYHDAERPSFDNGQGFHLDRSNTITTTTTTTTTSTTEDNSGYNKDGGYDDRIEFK